MGSRGRQSAAALSVVAPDSEQTQTSDPPGLTPAQKKIWNAVMSSRGGDLIAPEAYPVLVMYCRAVSLSDDIARAIDSRGRKNAKTTESAMILLLHLCGPEARQNSQLFSAAQSLDQAAILFSLAAKMVRLSIELSSCVVIRDTIKQLFCPDLGTL